MMASGESPTTSRSRRWSSSAWLTGAVVVLLFGGILVYGASRADADGDGLTDWEETRGWTTDSGVTYVTDPKAADTDGDGLTDLDEAGRTVAADGKISYSGTSNPTKADSDADGLGDNTEIAGWTSAQGWPYRTAPLEADTDGDGLDDGDEAGVSAPLSESGALVAFSDPTVRDSDGDRLDDAAEADLSLNPFAADSDRDGLEDRDEVENIGTAPDLADTDGDGFDDGYEVANQGDQGLDPLWPDVKVEASTYAWEFAKGAVVGELAPGDSLAWLAGNLASGSASLIPGIGWVAGGVADLRDSVGSALHHDWVGSAFTLVGVIPAVGDAAAVPAKVAKFVVRHPELAVGAGAVIATLKWVPEPMRASAVRSTAPEAFDDLRNAGVSVKSIMSLQQGNVGLATLADGVKRAGSDAAVKAPFFATGLDGERFLANVHKGSAIQQSFSTAGCVDVCNAVSRRFDVLVDGVAHESKVGRVYLSPGIKRQIESDAYCVRVGFCKGAEWHFFPSGVSKSLGASGEVLDLLDDLGIRYVIHLPE